MGKREDVSMLRVTDDAGMQLLAACVSAGSCGLLCVGEEESWVEHCRPITSVILDTSGALQITDPKDLEVIAAWMAAAAMWLQVAKRESEEDL